MTEASEVALSARLRGLCEEYGNRPYIVRRGVLATLVKFLSNETLEVRVNAAETLRLLSEHPENPEAMCKEKGLLQALALAYQTAENVDPEMFAVVGEVVGNLEAALDRRTEEQPAQPVIPETGSVMTAKNRGTRIIHSVVGRTRTVVVEVPTLCDANANTLSDLLETTRGVVSFSVDTVTHTISLYTSTSTPTILRLLEDKGYIAIVRSETQPQVAKGQGGGRNSAVPQYLSGKSGGGDGSEYLKSIVLHGVDGNSLSSRLERQKQEKSRNAKEKNAKQVGQLQGFFSKITTGWW